MNNYAISNNCIDNMEFNIDKVSSFHYKQRTVYLTYYAEIRKYLLKK